MSTKNREKKIKEITRMILTNQQKMIKEEDLRILCEGFEFDSIINEAYSIIKKTGFEMITTTFLEKKYYVITAEGKDDNITPSQYGTLALILAMSKEVDENIKLDDLKELFSEVWDTDIKFLIQNDYLRKININGLDILKVTPPAKAIMKDIIQDLQLSNLLKVFKDTQSE
jgi:hypothetical protein